VFAFQPSVGLPNVHLNRPLKEWKSFLGIPTPSRLQGPSTPALQLAYQFAFGGESSTYTHSLSAQFQFNPLTLQIGTKDRPRVELQLQQGVGFQYQLGLTGKPDPKMPATNWGGQLLLGGIQVEAHLTSYLSLNLSGGLQLGYSFSQKSWNFGASSIFIGASLH